MSQPTPYTPTTDFSQQEANNASGRSTVNTAALDAEFAAIDTTLDQTLANIQLLQRDDGRLMDVSVEVHTLSPEVLNLIGGYNLRGAWLANTDYAVNDTISHDSYLYVCKTAHNSGVTFSDINWIVFGFAGSNDAAQAAAQAAVSANEAHISELAAAASATTASGFATTATTQAGLASSSATAADASADAAAISETNAANSASDAASSASSISIPGGKAIVLKDSAGVSYVEGAAGTTAQRPGSPVVGYTRFNTTLNADETWSGVAWLVAGNVTLTGVETLTNKTLPDPKLTRPQFGTSATATHNASIDTSAADGTGKLARGNSGATTQDIMTWDAGGVVSFPQGTAEQPAGVIIDFAGTVAPTGYLACPTVAGGAQVVSRTTYAALFAAIGTAWGAGDGSTTFGIPWFPADYASVQANANVGTNHVGEPLAHSHTVAQRSTGTPNAATSAVGIGGTAIGPGSIGMDNYGGSSNRAAGVRVLKCVKY